MVKPPFLTFDVRQFQDLKSEGVEQARSRFNWAKMSYEKPHANDTNGRKWKSEEEEELLRLGEETDLTIDEITNEFEDRSRQAIKNKLRKLRKREGLYNSSHQRKKHKLNKQWINRIATEFDEDIRAFEGYAGTGESANTYLDFVDSLVCCEIDKSKFDRLTDMLKRGRKLSFRSPLGRTATDSRYTVMEVDGKRVTCYNENVNHVLHREVGEQAPFYDFIDLDPCGSPFVSIPQAIRLIKNGYLAVTYGDIHLQRWNRHAPLSKAYRMPKAESFSELVEYMIAWTMFEGVRQEHSEITRKLDVEHAAILSDMNSGVARVLYRVKKSKSLAPVLNHLEDALQEFAGGKSPMAARYDLEKANKNLDLSIF